MLDVGLHTVSCRALQGLYLQDHGTKHIIGDISPLNGVILIIAYLQPY